MSLVAWYFRPSQSVLLVMQVIGVEETGQDRIQQYNSHYRNNGRTNHGQGPDQGT